MDPDVGKAVLVRMIEMFATGDTTNAHSAVADEYIDHQGIGGGEVRGVGGFCEVVRVARSAFTTLDVWVEDLIQDHDRAAARIKWRGVLPSGVVVNRETIDIVRTVDGRAVEHWGCRIS